MGRIGLAIRAFFLALFDSSAAERLRNALAGETAPVVESQPPEKTAPQPQAPPPPPKPSRSEALTLLAALQREARLVDFVQEPLDAFSDAQVGAAARDVHRGCAEVIGRMFDLAPLSDQSEGAALEVEAGFDPGCYRLTGNVAGEPPFRGQLVHHGWQAHRCDLPQWSGSDSSAGVVAPIEVELK